MNQESRLDHLRTLLLDHARQLVPLSPSHVRACRERFPQLSGELPALLLSERAAALEWLSKQAEGENLPQALVFVEELMSEALLTGHPYLLLSQDHWRRWRTLHEALIKSLASLLRAARTPDDLAQRLHEVLSRYLDGLLVFLDDAGTEQHAGDAFLEQLPPCALYSPETQLSVLSLDATSLREPILDLGCGREARLFHHLTERGLRVVGVDRFVDPAPSLLRLDWFGFPLGAPLWGTILAHQSVSLHFLHHHLRQSPAALDYARLMMRLLNSLKPGGRLVYAPGLPFFEPLLDELEYRIHRFPITLPAGVRPLHVPDLAGAPLVACHIERLGSVH